MNSDRKTFVFESENIRVVLQERRPWFIAADVCSVLGLMGAASMHLNRLKPDQKQVICKYDWNTFNDLFEGKRGRISLISLSGFYAMTSPMLSSSPVAAILQGWVTNTVLPALHKDHMNATTERNGISGATQWL